MRTFIRLDEDHFAYLDPDISAEDAFRMMRVFETRWEGKSLLIFRADDFIDLTGKFEVLPIEALDDA